MFLGCDADVSLFKHLEGVVSECEWEQFGLMLISCWTAAGDVSFGQSTPVGPACFVPGQISGALCGLLLRII